MKKKEKPGGILYKNFTVQGSGKFYNVSCKRGKYNKIVVEIFITAFLKYDNDFLNTCQPFAAGCLTTVFQISKPINVNLKFERRGSQQPQTTTTSGHASGITLNFQRQTYDSS